MASSARQIQDGRRLAKRGATPDAVAQARRRLPAVFAAYPGIVTGPSGSQIHAADADSIVAGLVFDAGHLGRAAALAVEFIMSRMGIARDADLAGGDAEAPTCYRCSAKQLVEFHRYLAYGSELHLGDPRPARELSEPPLPTLLGHALEAFTQDYAQARADDRSTPQLGAWANVLRVLAEGELDQREIVRRAVISSRVAEVVVKRLERRGALTVNAAAIPGKRGKTKLVALTAQGGDARERAAALVKTVEDGWRGRFGGESVDRLRLALASVVDRLPIELPHYLTGYGAGDPSITGGDYLPEQPGPPRIPAHGQDWPVVLRAEGGNAGQLPLPALLSEVLAAFSIDYERERLGSLQAASNFLRFVGDDGVTLERARTLGGVSGNGKSLHERHVGVVVERGKARDMTRRVYLTPKSRRSRDAYPDLVTEIEERWREEYGDAVPTMLAALSAMDPLFNDGLPDYPDTNAWIHRLWFD